MATSTGLLPKHRVVLQAVWERRHGKIALTETIAKAGSCGTGITENSCAGFVSGEQPCLFQERQAGTVIARIPPNEIVLYRRALPPAGS